MADDLVKTPSKIFEGFRKTLPPCKGKTFVVTGTTSGTGYVLAKEVVRTGGKAIVLNRPSQRAEKSFTALQALCADGGSVVHIECDCSSFHSVRSALILVKNACDGTIDALVCNAGIGAFPDQRVDGYEYQMLTNFLTQWLLVRALMPCLEAAASAKGEARIVLHSSGAAFLTHKKTGRMTPLDARYLGKEPLPVDGTGNGTKARFRRYQQSKLAQLVAGSALAESLSSQGSSVKVLMANPGAAATGFFHKTAGSIGGLKGTLILGVYSLAKGFINTMEEGAMPLLVCACGSDVQCGEFYSPQRRVPRGGVRPGKKSKPVLRSLPVVQTREVLLAERGPEAWDLMHGEMAKKMALELGDRAVQPYLV
jgi:NAD(P)-dependent dehydrogenase (short-subunit alcohol dehydrogenase family)